MVVWTNIYSGARDANISAQPSLLHLILHSSEIPGVYCLTLIASVILLAIEIVPGWKIMTIISEQGGKGALWDEMLSESGQGFAWRLYLITPKAE